MKVLICAYDRPGHVATGPNAWLQRLVPNLSQNYGLEIHTLFIYGERLEDCPTISFFKENELPVSLINRDAQPYIADQVKALLNIVKSQNIQVVIANLVIPAFYATRYLKQAQIPVIGVLHSNDPFYKGVINKFIQGATEDHLTVTVSVSQFIGKLVSNGKSSTRLEVIPCGTPIPPVRTTWDNKNQLNVMYAGRMVVEQKQILKLTQAFLDAATKEPRLQFSIYGDGEQVEQVQHLLQTQIEDKVLYKGAVSPSKIIGCFKNHQVFTLMSDYEGMPVALMEAMACGLVPVCLEEASGVNEIIEHGVNGFIVKDREADYQKHLQLLLDQPELWERLSANAVKTIKERYSSAITHEQWYRLLNGYTAETIKSLKIPSRIKLEGPLLHYGDNRKPGRREVYLQKLQRHWMQVRLFVRPRARLRALLNK